jgi:hypothetical protein
LPLDISKFRQGFLKESRSCPEKIGIERIGTLSIQRFDDSKVHRESRDCKMFGGASLVAMALERRRA